MGNKTLEAKQMYQDSLKFGQILISLDKTTHRAGEIITGIIHLEIRGTGYPTGALVLEIRGLERSSWVQEAKAKIEEAKAGTSTKPVSRNCFLDAF